MKKPEYMEIRFPADLKDFNPATQKYFNSLLSKKIEINFAQNRKRKIFKYSVVFSENQTWTSRKPSKKTYNFLVRILQDNSKK